MRATRDEERALIDEQYAGRKTQLRPIAERLRAAALGLGADVTVETRVDEVAYARGPVFAVVRPTSATRVDLGLALTGAPPDDRLIPDDAFADEGVGHRVPLESLDDVDGVVLAWLALAYSQRGKERR